MDIVVAAVLTGLFVLLPLYFRSNVLLIIAALSFGWVLNDITGNELMLISRSVLPAVADGERFALLVFSFLPALAVVLLTKRSTKKSFMLLLSLGFMPGIFIVSWIIARASLPFEWSLQLSESQINQVVINNQEYALWAAAVVMLMSLFLSRLGGAASSGKPGKHKK